MAERLERVAEKKNYVVARVANVALLHWTGVPSMDALAPLERALQGAIAAGGPKKVGFYTLMEESMLEGPTPTEVRNGMGNLLKKYNENFAATTIAYEGSGLKASIIRGMITTINLMSRSTFHSSVQNNARTAAEWLIERMGANAMIESRELVQIINDLRAAHSASVAASAAV